MAAVSFVTNTNWQAYSGESGLSYLTQALGLTVQNFVSAATGIAVLFALIRGFIKVKSNGLGNFWVDMTKIILYILIPLNIVISIGLVSQGVVQNFKPAETVQLLEPIAIDKEGMTKIILYILIPLNIVISIGLVSQGVVQNFKPAETVQLLEPIAIDKEGNIIENAIIDKKSNTVSVDGEIVDGAEIIEEEVIPLGPAASQVAIKQTGTNGGGFYGVNSAHPLENPTIISNLLEMISILLIPAALCFTFGKGVNNKKQGIAIFMAMFIVVYSLGSSTWYSCC